VSISSHPHRGVRRKRCVGQRKKRCKSRERQAFDLKAHRQLEILLWKPMFAVATAIRTSLLATESQQLGVAGSEQATSA
jgi:hypothetical protein